MFHNVLKNNQRFAIKKCWLFDGINDRSTTASHGLWRNQKYFTFVGWLNLTSTGAAQCIFDWTYNANNRILSYAYHHASGKYYIAFHVNKSLNTPYCYTNPIVDYSTKVFIALIFNGDEIASNRLKILVNNVSSGTVSGTPPTETHNAGNAVLSIGINNSMAGPLKNKITHFAYKYTSLWSAADLTKFYGNGNGNTYTGANTIYEFDKPTGENIPDTGTDGLTLAPGGSPYTPQSGDWN